MRPQAELPVVPSECLALSDQVAFSVLLCYGTEIFHLRLFAMPEQCMILEPADITLFFFSSIMQKEVLLAHVSALWLQISLDFPCTVLPVPGLCQPPSWLCQPPLLQATFPASCKSHLSVL